jgi:putative ABC transport system substrate-binding protein
MTVTIGRRELLAALGGAVAWPLAARAQQRERMRRIGVLMNLAANDAEGGSVLEAKRLELLHELVPAADPIGVLVNREFTTDVEGQQLREITAAARAIGKSIKAVNANSESELEAAFAALAEARVGAVSVTGGTFNLNKRVQIVALAARYALPAIYENRESVTAGGLMSYGTNVPDVYRQVGIYVGRILKGDKPAELPFVQPAKFDMAVNLKTARALGITVPSALLLRADEVIE